MTTDWSHTVERLDARVLERRGAPLHYWVGGETDRPTIVMLHGATMDHRMFNAQIPALLDDHRVLVWDARGHGRSQPLGIENPTIDDYVDDLFAVLDDADIGSVLLMGQSMGAYISQHVILRYPERVEGLVVIGSTPIAFPLSWPDYAAVRFAGTSFRLWPLDHLRLSMAKATTVREDVRTYALEAMTAIGRHDLVQIFGAVATAIRRQGYPDFTVDVPFLLAHGEHDGTGNIRKDGPRWAASDPRITYVQIPDAGHNANQDNPDFFNQELLRFLTRFEA
ncbi:alpha/beta fold hydrolase [Microbacterium saperdae]